MITVKNLSKSFGRQEAVCDLSFTLGPGEVLGLIGPNGAGKTTILRCLTGILRPDRGWVSIGGFDLATHAVDAKRVLAYLPDQPSFFETLTCAEHVRFVAGLYRVPGYRDKADRLFEAFGLAEKRDSFVSELSRGMRQRLGLVCAFLHEPRVLLFDEPMLGLDPRGIKTLNEMILAHAARGATVILSSHLLSILQKCATKVLLLDSGRAKVYGTVEMIRPALPGASESFSLEELFFQVTEPDPPGRVSQ